ncbi:MAG: Gfo/Idh/MocA family oxidoreductase [Lentisphaerae bacterium]|nr:Gfo/Idh/MocA family oxidoreductase [Lentisphaerota bacterium]
MSKTYKAAILGFAHMHINNVAAQFSKHPQIEWVGCADTTPLMPELSEARYTRAWNKQNALAELGVPREYECECELLEQERPDIVVICSENVYHPDIVEVCAEVGAHVCVEKPMAMSLEDGLRMVRACEAGGTSMLINWPIAWSPAAREMKRLIDAEIIGKVLQVKYRAGHTGPLGPGAAHAGAAKSEDALTGPERASSWWHQKETGGGALIDFCCYGAMLSRWFIGEQAEAATAIKGNLNSPWGEVDDNGFMLVRFPGAVGLFEGSWSTLHHGVPTGPIVFGSSGTLVMENVGGKPTIRLERGAGQTEVFEPEALPPGHGDVASEFVHHLDTGAPLADLLAPGLNIEALAILDAGIRSAESGCLEMVGSRVWM